MATDRESAGDYRGMGNTDVGLPGAIQHLPLDTFGFHIGGRDWIIRAARDHAALLEVAEGFAEFPFGLLLWESAPVLAQVLAERTADFAGRHVLELGAGVGFAGIVASWLGAASVVQTDHVAEALALCRENAARNNVLGVEVALADWARWDDNVVYDLVIGSDVLYDRAVHAPFAAILERNLAPDGRVLLTDPGRMDTPLFLNTMMSAGWEVNRSRRTAPALLPGGADTVDVDVIDLKRSL